MIVPEAVTQGAMGTRGSTNLLHYSGIKEDVYAPELQPDASVLTRLGLHADGSVIGTVQPPATEMHYHNPESEILFSHLMNRAVGASQVKVILLPHNKRQETEIRSRWPHWFA